MSFTATRRGTAEWKWLPARQLEEGELGKELNFWYLLPVTQHR